MVGLDAAVEDGDVDVDAFVDAIDLGGRALQPADAAYCCLHRLCRLVNRWRGLVSGWTRTRRPRPPTPPLHQRATGSPVGWSDPRRTHRLHPRPGSVRHHQPSPPWPGRAPPSRAPRTTWCLQPASAGATAANMLASATAPATIPRFIPPAFLARRATAYAIETLAASVPGCDFANRTRPNNMARVGDRSGSGQWCTSGSQFVAPIWAVVLLGVAVFVLPYIAVFVYWLVYGATRVSKSPLDEGRTSAPDFAPGKPHVAATRNLRGHRPTRASDGG